MSKCFVVPIESRDEKHFLSFGLTAVKDAWVIMPSQLTDSCSPIVLPAA